jgi:hypothetical protein
MISLHSSSREAASRLEDRESTSTVLTTHISVWFYFGLDESDCEAASEQDVVASQPCNMIIIPFQQSPTVTNSHQLPHQLPCKPPNLLQSSPSLVSLMPRQQMALFVVASCRAAGTLQILGSTTMTAAPTPGPISKDPTTMPAVHHIPMVASTRETGACSPNT